MGPGHFDARNDGWAPNSTAIEIRRTRVGPIRCSAFTEWTALSMSPSEHTLDDSLMKVSFKTIHDVRPKSCNGVVLAL